MPGPFKIGLTGSIGMGKSTTAAMFADAGVPVWDADAAVARLYGPGGVAGPPLSYLRPDAVGADGAVDRDVLRAWIAGDRDALRQIEQIVHPLVAADRATFLARTVAPVVVLDIPLLFETGSAADMDMVVVVSTDPDTQRARVLARPGMTEARFQHLLGQQIPDADKRAQADMIVRSDTLETARADVQSVLDKVGERHA